jgi:hypothetical protein
MRSERATSFLDRRHRFTLAWTYETPWFRGSPNGFLRHVFGNYTLSSVYTYESPQMVTVQSGRDSNLNFDSAADRAIVNVNGIANTGSNVYGIDGNGARVATGDPTTVAYVAENANTQYIAAGLGALANSGRNTLPTRPINNVDLSVKKVLPLGEIRKLEVGGIAFNVLNHAQYTPGFVNNVRFRPGLSTINNLIPGNAMFNRPDLAYASNSRTMQWFARLEF